MEIIALIEDLAQRGISLLAEPPELVAESDIEIAETDRALIRVHKDELLVALLEKAARLEAEQIALFARRDERRAATAVRRATHAPNRCHFETPGPLVLTIDPGEFGACDVCGNSAALILPWESAISGKRRFCGIGCLRTVKYRTTKAAAYA